MTSADNSRKRRRWGTTIPDPRRWVLCSLRIQEINKPSTHYPRRLCRSAWVGFSSKSVCLSVCPQHNSKTNDPKVFKLGVGNDLGIYYKWCCFGVQRSKVKVTRRINAHTVNAQYLLNGKA